MIIKDVNGGQLSLTKTTLTEITGTANPREKWKLRLEDLAKTRRGEEVDLYLVATDVRPDMVGKNVGAAIVNPASYRIGCRYFSEKVYNQIARAANFAAYKPVRKPKRKPAKKGKK